MCMHIYRENSLDSILAHIADMNQRELDRLQESIDRRRSELRKKQSTVVERRDYRNRCLAAREPRL
jgi:hypothetical protein